jgi:hypothetical protein
LRAVGGYLKKSGPRVLSNHTRPSPAIHGVVGGQKQLQLSRDVVPFKLVPIALTVAMITTEIAGGDQAVFDCGGLQTRFQKRSDFRQLTGCADFVIGGTSRSRKK